MTRGATTVMTMMMMAKRRYKIFFEKFTKYFFVFYVDFSVLLASNFVLMIEVIV